MFEFHFAFVADDMSVLRNYLTFDAPRNKKMMFRKRFFEPVILFLAGCVFGMQYRVPGHIFAIGAAITLAWILGYRRMKIAQMRDYAKRLAVYGEIMYSKDTCWRFEESEFVFQDDWRRVTARYAMLLHVESDESAVYLYDMDYLAHSIPVRAFANPEEKVRFEAFIRAKIDEAKAEREAAKEATKQYEIDQYEANRRGANPREAKAE